MEDNRIHRHWQKIGRDERRGRWATFHVTMCPKGIIAISRFTLETLGDPEAFFLLFDKLNHTIGLQPTRKTEKDAYPTARRGTRGAKTVRAFRLCQVCGVRLPQTIRFTAPEIDHDGVLILDLRSAIPAAKKNREAAAAKVA